MIGPKLDPEMAALSASQSDALKQKLGLDKLRRELASGKTEEQKLRSACEGFEAVFVNKLWKQMRSNVPQEGYLHSREEKHYVGLFDQKLAEKLSSAGGIGIGDMLFEQLREQLIEGTRSSRAIRNPNQHMNSVEDPRREVRAEGISLTRKPALNVISDPMEEGAKAPSASVAETIREPQVVASQVEDIAVATAKPQASPELMAKAMQVAARIEYEHARRTAARSAGLVEPTANAESRGMLSWPALGRVVGEFGWRTDPVTGGQEWHPGLDISGREGDPVAACWGGKVVFAGERGRYGNAVVIEHPGGWRSMYGHNKENLVEIGQVVRAGEKIAQMGSTGSAPGTILHFELRQGEQAMNPERVKETLQAELPTDDNA